MLLTQGRSLSRPTLVFCRLSESGMTKHSAMVRNSFGVVGLQLVPNLEVLLLAGEPLVDCPVNGALELRNAATISLFSALLPGICLASLSNLFGRTPWLV